MSANTLITVVIIGGVIVGLVMFWPKIATMFSPSPGTLTQWLPAWLGGPGGTNYGSGRGPGPNTPPGQAGLISKTTTSPPASTGGGVGGPSKPVPGFGLPKAGSAAPVAGGCGVANRNAAKCAALKNSPGTYASCCASLARAFPTYRSGRARKVKHMRSFNNVPMVMPIAHRVIYRHSGRVRKLPTVYQR